MHFPIQIELAGVPVGKGRPRFSRKTGRAYTPAKTASYESHLRLAAQEAMGDNPPVDMPLALQVFVALPVPQSWSKKKKTLAEDQQIFPQGRPDLDNFVKAALDALNNIVFVDDARVVNIYAEKRYDERPRLWVSIEPVLARPF